jgi:hypothetical protein
MTLPADRDSVIAQAIAALDIGRNYADYFFERNGRSSAAKNDVATITAALASLRSLASAPADIGRGGMIEERDLPLFWQGRANALKIVNSRRDQSDPETAGQIQAYQECAEELRRALASAPADQSDAGRDGVIEALEKLISYVEWHMPIHIDEKQHPTYSKPMADARSALASLRTPASAPAEDWRGGGTKVERLHVSDDLIIRESIPVEHTWKATAAPADQSDAGRDGVIEGIAAIVRGVVYADHYRAWPELEVENRTNTDHVTRQCDALADAILKLRTEVIVAMTCPKCGNKRYPEWCPYCDTESAIEDMCAIWARETGYVEFSTFLPDSKARWLKAMQPVLDRALKSAAPAEAVGRGEDK